MVYLYDRQATFKIIYALSIWAVLVCSLVLFVDDLQMGAASMTIFLTFKARFEFTSEII